MGSWGELFLNAGANSIVKLYSNIIYRNAILSRENPPFILRKWNPEIIILDFYVTNESVGYFLLK